jgi:nucleoside-diphosphate-sugar epimerase
MSFPLPSRRALVTGATGFIGSNLVSRLVGDGWNTTILALPGTYDQHLDRAVCVHEYDGTTESAFTAVTESRPDVVFHLASLFLVTHEPAQVTRLVESNILFGTQLLEAMSVHGTKYLVNVGSYWQHYQDRDYDPVCLYAATKQAFEAILAFFVNARHLSAITLKLFDTYGPKDTRPKLLRLLQTAAAEGQTLQMSPGEQLISLVYIDDVIDAFLNAAERLLGGAVEGSEIYAVNADQPLRLRELVETFGKIAGRTVNVEWGARPYRAREMMTPWTYGARLPQWTPKVTLEEGLRRIVAPWCDPPAPEKAAAARI